jgi:prepilin-type N-terminal cleavage/methylation domain-containing protein
MFTLRKDINSAFTLVELLVVIAIVGLLSTIILISTSGLREQAEIAKTLQWAKSIDSLLGADAVGIWSMDESPAYHGTEIKDLSGWGNHGTLYTNEGTAVNKSEIGVINGALSFDGIDDYVDVPNPGLITNGSIETWFYFPSNFAEETVPRNALFGFNKSGTLANETHATFGGYSSAWAGELLTINVDGNYGGWTGNQLFGMDYAPAGWHHFVFTRDESGGKIYLNGDEVTIGPALGTNPLSITTVTAPFHAADHSVNKIGAMRNTLDYFNGFIDETHVYSVALTASQIQSQYYAGLNKLLAKKLIDKQEYQQRLAIN